MLASYGLPNHAHDAKSLIVKFPQADQLVDDRLLLGATSKLWYVAWIFKYRISVEVGAKAISYGEKKIVEEVS